eukprot:8702562-Karenia_brevis.AAC.1
MSHGAPHWQYELLDSASRLVHPPHCCMGKFMHIVYGCPAAPEGFFPEDEYPCCSCFCLFMISFPHFGQ